MVISTCIEATFWNDLKDREWFLPKDTNKTPVALGIPPDESKSFESDFSIGAAVIHSMSVLVQVLICWSPFGEHALVLPHVEVVLIWGHSGSVVVQTIVEGTTGS